MSDEKLESILARRDKFEVGSAQWDEINEEKANYLESIKPSTREKVVYFDEDDLEHIKGIFTTDSEIFDLPFGIERRSLLEYYPEKRHPIVYALIKYQSRYFFILRGSKGGEFRLLGKKGLAGGHISEEDVVEGDLEKTFRNTLLREVKEEVGINENMIKTLKFLGIIKSDLGVDFDHLGLVYEIELNTDEIKSEEEGVLTGIWVPKGELPVHYENFENWSKIVYDNLLK